MLDKQASSLHAYLVERNATHCLLVHIELVQITAGVVRGADKNSLIIEYGAASQVMKT